MKHKERTDFKEMLIILDLGSDSAKYPFVFVFSLVNVQ